MANEYAMRKSDQRVQQFVSQIFRLFTLEEIINTEFEILPARLVKKKATFKHLA